MILQRFGRAQDGLVSQPDGKSLAPGLVSLAELPVHRGPGNARVGQQIGYRSPQLKGLSATLGSGARLAVADRHAAATMPDASQEEQEVAIATRDSNTVKKNCHARPQARAKKFGWCSG